MSSLDPQLLTHLTSWLRSEGAESPLLLYGSPSIDWNTVLIHAAKIAVCQSTTEVPCNSCKACEQAGMRQHPNVVWVAPETRSIKMKDIQEIREELTRTTFSGHRIIIIPQANRLLHEASNALLKELEEPATSNRFLLTTSYLKRVLPTIVSRCHLVRITQPVLQQSELDPAIWQKLDGVHNIDTLTEEELTAISTYVLEQVERGQVAPTVYRTLLRLRDYYKIRAHRGNEKLATQVLLASLSQVRHTGN